MKLNQFGVDQKLKISLVGPKLGGGGGGGGGGEEEERERNELCKTSK